MYGFWSPNDVYGQPTLERPVERFCLDRGCACKHTVMRAEAACWACGGETSEARPPWWPNTGSSQTVRGGNSFSLSELDDDPDAIEGAA